MLLHISYHILSYVLNNTSSYALQHVSGIDRCYVDVHNCIGVYNYEMIIRIANKVEKKREKNPSDLARSHSSFYPYTVG